MNLLNKIGFYQTLRLLSSINGEVKLKTFYAKFNEESYYNAFLRVKGELLDAKLISISRGSNKKKSRTIKLTKRGEKVWSLLTMVINNIHGDRN